MVRIRRFGIVQTANVVAAIYAIVIAIFFLPIAAFIAVAGRETGLGEVGAVAVVVGGPIIALIYAVVIWIFTALAAALYNLVAGRVGGIEIQLETVMSRPEAPVATWGQPRPSAAAPPPPEPPGAQGA